MAVVDVYRVTDQHDDGTSQILVDRLESRGKHPRFQELVHGYLEAMRIDTAGSVLDLGCGTGVVARAAAARLGPAGKVVGVDRSRFLIEAATRIAAHEGLAGRVEFRVGDTQALDLPAESFDAVIANTLISHVERPLAVLEEARRVARPGALIAVVDGDYASLTFAQADPAQTKKDDEAVINGLVTNPYVMRLLPRLARQAGLEVVTVVPRVILDAGRADFWGPSVESFRKLLPRSGVWTEAKANAWADDMARASAEGCFFAASTFYTYLLRRPPTAAGA